jgi:fructose-bisphosphate aldolase class I
VADEKMLAQVREKQGFFAAPDQSGGSTPGAFKLYGIPESAYRGGADMFKLIHETRVRIITAPAFTGDKVIGAILLEATMETDRQWGNPFRPSCGRSAASYPS